MKGKSVTTERKTNKSLEEQVEALKKENADLRTELEQLKLVHRSKQEAREDIREERRSEQGLCSPCAAYLLRLQEQASNVDRRNQRHRKEEVDENPKVRERKKQETFSHRSMLEQEADDCRNDCADVRVAEEGRKIWKMKGEEEQEGWTTVKGRKRQNANKGEHGQISTSNRFSVLDSEMKEGKKKVGCLVVGDSRVRPLEKTFCEKRDRCVAKMGAVVSDMDAILQEELERYDPEVIILQVGVNNVGPRRSVQLMKDYSALLQRLKEARKPVIVTGILPRATASREWYSRALSANASVETLCLNMGLHFVDLWEDFFGRWEFYMRDGLHLSDEGAKILGEAYRHVIRGNWAERGEGGHSKRALE